MPFRSRGRNLMVNIQKSLTENIGSLGGGDEDELIVDVSHYSVLGIQLVQDEDSHWDSKVKFECSNDGENWEDLEVVDSDDGTSVRTVTNTEGDEGLFFADVAGIKYVQISSTDDGGSGYVEVIVTKE